MFWRAVTAIAPGALGVVEALPVTTRAPLAEIPVHTGPLWILRREHTPCDTPVDNIKNRGDHRPHSAFPVVPTRLGWRNQIFATLPFGLSEVCWVWFRCHSHRLLS